MFNHLLVLVLFCTEILMLNCISDCWTISQQGLRGKSEYSDIILSSEKVFLTFSGLFAKLFHLMCIYKRYLIKLAGLRALAHRHFFVTFFFPFFWKCFWKVPN